MLGIQSEKSNCQVNDDWAASCEVVLTKLKYVRIQRQNNSEQNSRVEIIKKSGKTVRVDAKLEQDEGYR